MGSPYYMQYVGTEAQSSARDDSTSATTANAYQRKVRFTTPDLKAGNYTLWWHCEVFTDNPSIGVCQLRVRQNDGEAGEVDVTEVQISGRGWKPVDGSRRLRTGDRLRIDGSSGQVEVLS